MNQENHNEEEIRETIRDLDSVGLSPRLKVSFYFGVNPNEFLYTNINKFIEFYWEKNSISQETSVEYFQESGSLSEKRRHVMTVFGPQHEVQKIVEDFPEFPWVDPNSIESISHEWI